MTDFGLDASHRSPSNRSFERQFSGKKPTAANGAQLSNADVDAGTNLKVRLLQ